MRFKILSLLALVILLCSCKKNNGDDNTSSYISATINGKSYNSNNVIVIRTPGTNNLFGFSATTADNLSIGIQLSPSLPAYDVGTYPFTPAHVNNAILSSFTIKDTNATTLLKWTTEVEVNLSYFEIQRSPEGTIFMQLGNVTAAGNSSSAINYTFTDNFNRTVQNYYYRLKMVNLDGSYTYSQVILYSGFNSYTAYYGENSLKYKGTNGNIHVTGNDLVKRVVTGDFTFDVTDNAGQTKQIRNGKFRIFY